jgi:hypothetical protein
MGEQGEQAALEALAEKGYTVLTEQLYVSTSEGLRITDVVVTGGPAGDEIAGFEIKVNGSPYTPLQQLKDSVIAGPQGGCIIGYVQTIGPLTARSH